MAQSPIATAADYADAMIAARRAKNWLFLLLLLMLFTQLGVFLVARFRHLGFADKWFSLLQYLTALIDFLGIALVVVLAMVLLLIVKIMLVGRLIGVARVTSAYIWCLLLAVMLFPWQTFLTSPLTSPSAANRAAPATTAPPVTVPAESASPAPDFKVPGVLYTWAELTDPVLGANFNAGDTLRAMLSWSRYVAFPLLAVVVLMMVQSKSSHGLRMALGEAEPEPDEYQATA